MHTADIEASWNVLLILPENHLYTWYLFANCHREMSISVFVYLIYEGFHFSVFPEQQLMGWYMTIWLLLNQSNIAHIVDTFTTYKNIVNSQLHDSVKFPMACLESGMGYLGICNYGCDTHRLLLNVSVPKPLGGGSTLWYEQLVWTISQCNPFNSQYLTSKHNNHKLL